MSETLYKNEHWIREQYFENRLSVDQIASKFGIERSAIFRSMRKLDIPRRTIATARAIKDETKLYRQDGWLRKQYHQRKFSKDQIAEICGTDSGTITRQLEKYGIPERNKEEVAKLRNKNLLKTLHGSYWNRFRLIGKDLVKSFRRYF